MKRQVVLIILDGWGVGAQDNSNPIYKAAMPSFDYIKSNFPAGALQASGIAVGLPWSEEGNSEVGHLTIGAGKVIYQHFPRISLAIQNGSFAKNKAFLDAFAHAKKNQSAVHLVGCLSRGNIQSSFEHLLALIKLAQQNGLDRIRLHLFTDGQDDAPRAAGELIKKLPLPPTSLSGRYYALDAGQHWERTRDAYAVLIGTGTAIATVDAALEAHYKRGLTDQFLAPALIGVDVKGIDDNDAVIFFNFREDGMRQIAEPFVNQQFKHFPIKNFHNLFVVTMTRYADQFNVPVAFPPETVHEPLGKVLADAGKSQLRVSEAVKYPQITYFLNGLRDQTFPNEYRVLIPSSNDPHPEEHPEMMAREITSRIVQAIEEKAFDCVIANYANGDVIGHTGNFEAGIQAAQAIDAEIGAVIKAALDQNTCVLITGSHGNLEKMSDPFTAIPTSTNDSSPVPVYLVGSEFQKKKNSDDAVAAEREVIGILSDIAPTILALLDLPKPPEMTGQNLLPILD